MNRRDFIKSATIFTAVSYTSSLNAKDKSNISIGKRRKIRFKGKILVNGKPITKNTIVKSNDSVKSIGKNSFAMFSIGSDAFKIGNGAEVKFSGVKKVGNIEVKSGKLLAVFLTGRKSKIKTQNATIGIRGTGVFVEAISKKETIFCTCYGKTTVNESTTKNIQNLEATHHNSVVIADKKVTPDSILKRGYHLFISPTHTDDELRELEAMVGRVPSFDANGKKPFIEM